MFSFLFGLLEEVFWSILDVFIEAHPRVFITIILVVVAISGFVWLAVRSMSSFKMGRKRDLMAVSISVKTRCDRARAGIH